MSHRCTVFMAVMVLVTSAAFASDAPELTPEQKEVWKVSQAWLSAYNHRDLDAFARFTADDFIGATDDGIFMTKTRLINRISTHPPEADQRTNVHDVSVRVNGDTAVVNYRLSLAEEGFDSGKLIFELRRTEIFQKSNGAWLAIAAHDSLLPINHREPVKVDPKTFKDYAGEYEHFRAGFRVTYTVEGDHLIDEWKGDKIEAFPMGKDTFFEREDLGWTTFTRDRQGQVTGYLYHYSDGQIAAGRKIK
jgi:ketosteroid isomerase-like protein